MKHVNYLLGNKEFNGRNLIVNEACPLEERPRSNDD